jgi:hypothetical protein
MIKHNSKEIQWVNALLQIPGIQDHIEWIHDKPFYAKIKGGCCDTSRRIDLWSIVDGVLIAIEIDEIQHKYRVVGYEEDRYNDIFMDFSGHQIFLRINPDSFKIDGVKQNLSFDERFETAADKLLEIIDGIVLNKSRPEDLIQIHHLFYDS